MIETIIFGISSSGIFLHASYILLICFLFIDKRKSSLILDKALEKNLAMGDALDNMRIEIKTLHSELVQLVKENHSLNYEIQLLTHQVNSLRAEMQKSKV